MILDDEIIDLGYILASIPRASIRAVVKEVLKYYAEQYVCDKIVFSDEWAEFTKDADVRQNGDVFIVIHPNAVWKCEKKAGVYKCMRLDA